MAILLLLLLLFTPVHLTLTWDQGFSAGVHLWGIGRKVPLPQSSRNAQTRGSHMRIIGTLLRTDKARRFLMRHAQVTTLQALLHLGLPSAASTAVYTGLLQLIAQLLPSKADIRIQPDFCRPTRVQVRCIVFFHLGTLLITAGMLLWAYLLEAREHPIPRSKEA